MQLYEIGLLLLYIKLGLMTLKRKKVLDAHSGCEFNSIADYEGTKRYKSSGSIYIDDAYKIKECQHVHGDTNNVEIDSYVDNEVHLVECLDFHLPAEDVFNEENGVSTQLSPAGRIVSQHVDDKVYSEECLDLHILAEEAFKKGYLLDENKSNNNAVSTNETTHETQNLPLEDYCEKDEDDLSGGPCTIIRQRQNNITDFKNQI